MAINPLVANMLFGFGRKPGMTGTPPFVPPQQGSMTTPQGSGGFFDKADQFLSRPGGSFLMNLLAQDGYSTMPQSPLAAVGRAGLMTQQQQQEAGMGDLQRRMLESQIGLNEARSDAVLAGGGKNGTDAFGKLTPDKFTPESLATFQKTRNYGDLVPRTDEAGDPNAVREFQYFQSLSPKEQETYLKVKRAQQIDNVPGAGLGATNPLTNSFETIVPEQTIVSGTGDRASASAAGTATGKADAEAAIDLPKSEIRAETALGTLDKMLNHPGLPGAVGMKGPAQLFGMKDKPLAGTREADFVALVDQASGTAFLEAFQELKGGGHITEIEGQKAEQAVARIRDRGQTEEAYKEAILDLQGIIKKGIERKRSAAQGIRDFSTMSDEELQRIANGG